MAKCWANSLGGCSKEQSGEHYVSAGLFSNNTVTISGFKWLEGETKTVGLSSMKANILCRDHNTKLSPLDSEAIKFFRILDKIILLENKRSALRQVRFWNVIRYEVDGLLFERWLAKTIVGLFCVVGKDEFWPLGKAACNAPPESIVNAIYGKADFEAPMGLYVAHIIGENNAFPDGVSIAPLFQPNGGIVGATVEFKGIRFLIWLNSDEVGSFEISEGKVIGPDGHKPMYRLRMLEFKTAHRRSQILELKWK